VGRGDGDDLALGERGDFLLLGIGLLRPAAARKLDEDPARGGAEELLAHPKCGASWEGYAIEQAIAVVQPDETYFWATHQGAELDLLLFKDGRRFGVEAKRADAPRLTRSTRIALDALKLEHLAILYPGSRGYALSDRVTVVPLEALAQGEAGRLIPARKRQ